MNYDYISKELIEFISNPILNMKYLEKKTYKFRIMFYLSSKPIIGDFIKKLYPKIFFEKELLYFLKISENEIEKLKSVDYPISKINLDILNKICNNYIDIISNEICEEYEMEALLIKIEYILDRIKEHHNLKIENIDTKIIEKEVLVISYLLTEILYYLSADILELKYKNQCYIFKVKNKNKLKLKSYWVSEILEDNTKRRDNDILKSFSLNDKSKISQALSNKIISYVFDKFLYLQLKYLEKDILQNEKFIFLKQIVLFASIFESFVLNGKKIISRKEILKMGILNNEIIDFLIKNLDTEEEPFYFIRYKNNKFYRGSLEFKFGIRNYVGKMIELKDIEWKKNCTSNIDLGGMLGEAFEKQYILNFFKIKLEKHNFKTYEKEFKSGTKAKIKGYDTDIVLYNEKFRVYYFIQVKFKFFANYTYLHERIKFFNGEYIQKGIDQLSVLRDNFNDPSIREKLKNHKLENATLENSYFILLHNVPFLNFYEYKGIFMYEWNLLRNILQDGYVELFENNFIKSKKNGKSFEIFNIESILDYYLNNNEPMKQKYEWYKECFYDIKLMGKSFICKDI